MRFLSIVLTVSFGISVSVNTSASPAVRISRSKDNQTWSIETRENGHRIERVIRDSPNPRAFPRLLERRIIPAGEYRLRSGFNRMKSGEEPALDPSLAEVVVPVTEVEGEVLWTVENTWSFTWEEAYARWVKESTGPEFLRQHGIATDCADVAFSLRWIFARINHLPVANRLAGAGKWMTHESMKREWVALPTDAEWSRDRRFLAALNYLLILTYTHSLSRDSYPIAVDPRFFLAGMHHLSLHDDSGHTYVIHGVDTSVDALLPIEVMYSTTPREVRPLMISGYWNQEQPRPGEGFLRMRWPVWQANEKKWELAAATDHPGHSIEQYSPEFMPPGELNFAQAVIKKLIPGYNPMLRLQEGLKSLETLFLDRIQVVEQGAAICLREGCAEGSANYEAWSTPSRDARLGELILGLQNQVRQLSTTLEGVIQYWNQALDRGGIPWSNGTELVTLRQLVWHWLTKTYSSDPRRPVGIRWGIDPEAFIQHLQSGVEDIVRRREIQVQAAEICRTDPAGCPIQSELWNKFSTFLMDGGLLEFAFLPREYCTVTGGTNRDHRCTELKQRLENEVVSIHGQSVRWPQLSDRVLALNSDPRQSIEKRWGDVASQLLPLVAFTGRFGQEGIAVQDRQVVSLKGKPRLMVYGYTGGPNSQPNVVLSDMISRSVIAPPMGGAWIGLVSESNTAIARVEEAGQTYLILLVEGQREVGRIPWPTWVLRNPAGLVDRVRLTRCSDDAYQLGPYWLDFGFEQGVKFGLIPSDLVEAPLGQYGECRFTAANSSGGQRFRGFSRGEFYDVRLPEPVRADAWVSQVTPRHLMVRESIWDESSTPPMERHAWKLVDRVSGRVVLDRSEVSSFVTCNDSRRYFFVSNDGKLDYTQVLPNGDLAPLVSVSDRKLAYFGSDDHWTYFSPFDRSSEDQPTAFFYRCALRSQVAEGWEVPIGYRWNFYNHVAVDSNESTEQTNYWEWGATKPLFSSGLASSQVLFPEASRGSIQPFTWQIPTSTAGVPGEHLLRIFFDSQSGNSLPIATWNRTTSQLERQTFWEYWEYSTRPITRQGRHVPVDPDWLYLYSTHAAFRIPGVANIYFLETN